MIIGFTGTQRGLNPDQFDRLLDLIKQLDPRLAHHGDCIGADATFHAICLDLNIPIVLHPPEDPSRRAFCAVSLMIKATKPYLDRNHDIVDECDVLIACPYEETEQRRSGTWSTWRYAKKQGKEIYLLLP